MTDMITYGRAGRNDLEQVLGAIGTSLTHPRQGVENPEANERDVPMA